MSSRELPNAEQPIRAAWAANDVDLAVKLALETYGPEVFGFLRAILQDLDAADDAFSIFAEQLWRTFGAFEWRCSARTWVYLLARRAAAAERRGELRHARGKVPLSGAGEALDALAQVRTETLTALRTETRSAVVRLRDELPEEERMLLVLRVDRQLPWKDVTRILVPDVEEAELAVHTTRLRKRFQLVRERLARLGKERGLL